MALQMPGGAALHRTRAAALGLSSHGSAARTAYIWGVWFGSFPSRFERS